MSSLGDVGAELRAVLDKIDQSIAAHHRAAELAEDARALLATAGTGSVQDDVEQVCAVFTIVMEKITEPEGQISALATAADLIRTYLTRQGLATGAADSSATVPPPKPAPVADPTDAAHVDNLRATLPPEVEPGAGQKTHGQWFADGQGQALPIVSGEDDESEEAWRILREVGCPLKGPPITMSHVEMKLAARMNRDKVRQATLVLNNIPCDDIWGCDNLLPIILPAGYTLTVYGPNYQKTFTGGRRPWRQR